MACNFNLKVSWIVEQFPNIEIDKRFPVMYCPTYCYTAVCLYTTVFILATVGLLAVLQSLSQA